MSLDYSHVPLPVVHAAVEEQGFTPGSMVTAIGGDGDPPPHPPCNECWRSVKSRWEGRVCRWVPKVALRRIQCDLHPKRPGQPFSKKYGEKKRAADRYWATRGGETAKQAALIPVGSL